MKTLLLIISMFILFSCINLKEDNESVQKKTKLVQEVKIEQKLLSKWLKTDTSKISINFDNILNWWPGKDGIPSINNPNFFSIENAEKNMSFLKDESQGIWIEIDGKAKFYPYEILVWHEIVNDKLWLEKFAVTFCPLCWSAIVYDRVVGSEEIIFWVSGLLYESNLLMYDDKTESLWSQSLWKSVVWDYLGKELNLVNSNLMTFKEYKSNYPDWMILSDDTWFNRNYWYVPYWDYNENDIVYFPVENSDIRYHKKEIFYIINDKGNSIAFLLKDLRELWEWEINVWDRKYIATFNNWIIDVKNWNKSLNWYYEMWFSWINHNIWNKNIWSK